MALDDFTTAEEEEEAGVVSNFFAEREALDEDLFDFPPVVFGDPKNDVVAEQPPAPLPDEEARAEAAAEVTSSPMAKVEAPAPAPQETEAPAPQAIELEVAAAVPEHSADPDEDLFDFGELFSPMDLAASDDHLSKADLFDETVPAITPEVAHDPVAVAPAIIAEAPAGVPAHAPATPQRIVAVAAPQSPIRTRVLFGLVGSILLLNAILIMIAWQTSRAFQTTLEGVRADLSSQPAITRPIVIQAPAPGAVPAGSNAQPAVPLDDYETQELSLARGQLASGQFAEARIRLYQLIANRDRMNLTDNAIADAEYLIAESYFMQAKSLPGGTE